MEREQPQMEDRAYGVPEIWSLPRERMIQMAMLHFSVAEVGWGVFVWVAIP